MSTEENKAIVCRVFEEGYNTGNFDVWDEIFAPDLMLHQAPWPDISSLEQFKQVESMNRAAWPDLHFNVEDLIAEGDKVVVRYTVGGTHKGEWAGIPATGKHAATTGMIMYRFANGKIVEAWVNVSFLAIYQQLGVTPPTGEGKE